MEKIVLLSSLKTKNGKTMLTYGVPIKKGNKKGFDVLTDYPEIADLHDKFGLNDFGRIFDAEMGYKDTYNGQAVKRISSLYTEDGELIFEI